MSFESVNKFEIAIANFFGAPFAVAVDSCTHGIELSLRYLNEESINVPCRTYLSIPFLSKKLGIQLNWDRKPWKDLYYLTDKVIDAAVLWKRNSYISGKFMSISFQYQKHLSLGRGGMILCPDESSYKILKMMSYDGRTPDIPWRNQNIQIIGYHYYMTPETAQLGIDKLDDAIKLKPKIWNYEDWPDLTKMEVFHEK